MDQSGRSLELRMATHIVGLEKTTSTSDAAENPSAPLYRRQGLNAAGTEVQGENQSRKTLAKISTGS